MQDADHEAPGCVGPVPNLQDAFAEFVKTKQQRSKGGAAAGGSKRSPPAKPPSPGSAIQEERRAQLRALFLETARGFIGVPYSRKHHDACCCACEGCSTSGRQLYHSPLFLDCCGLVRKVVRSMQRQLGFRLGPGNQAYQYDTLPGRLERASQLKPGDLIFYSGTYYEKGSRRHAFDMTHVEVFVGGPTGEATIGSRERYKWVMEYDSFRFQSRRWELTSYHFCSIDAWLDGVCVPQHPELWRPRRRVKQQQQQVVAATAQGSLGGTAALTAWGTSKYSIFGGALATRQEA